MWGQRCVHAHRAVAAARAGADMLSVSALGCLAQALFFAGELDEARRVAVQDGRATRRAGRPRRLRRNPRAACPHGRRARADRERRGVGSAGAVLRAPALPSRLVCRLTGASGAGAGVRRDRTPRRGRARGATRRASATRTTAHRGPRARAARTRPGAAGARAAGASRPRPRARRTCDRGVSRSGAVAGDRGRDRADRSSPLEPTAATTKPWKNPARPSSPCCEASPPVSPAARSARSSTSR